METWRWIESEPTDGATNMAIDQALLDNAVNFGQPTMRVYQWFPYCLSLGYHQSGNEFDLDLCKRRQIDVVRRPTGGRAVLHAEEVTYAVIVPRDTSLFQHSIAAVYRNISRGLLAGIRKMGIPATFEKRSIDLRRHYNSQLSSVNCFSASAKYEIVIDGKKLIGSAQRHLSDGLLQHGSILSGSAHLTLPGLLKNVREDIQKKMTDRLTGGTISLEQCLGKKISFREVVKYLKEGMEEALSVKLIQNDMTEKEMELAEGIRHRFSILSNNKSDVKG